MATGVYVAAMILTFVCGGLINQPVLGVNQGKPSETEPVETVPVATCGNGVRDLPGEQCDGDDISGCSEGQVCQACKCTSLVNAPVCGDGVRNLPAEQCDSSDLTGCQLGQLCNTACQCVWSSSPTRVATACSDQYYCSEDPNQKGTLVHVRADCSVELLPGNPSCAGALTGGGSSGGGGSTSVCGNGIIEPGEVCDPPQAVCGGCLPTCDGYITLCKPWPAP